MSHDIVSADDFEEFISAELRCLKRGRKQRQGIAAPAGYEGWRLDRQHSGELDCYFRINWDERDNATVR